VIQTKREQGPTPAGGAYSIVSWDDETGNAEILEYDAADQLICRREWENFPGAPGPDRVVGEVRTFDPAGHRIATRALTWSEGTAAWIARTQGRKPVQA
jgi:YD repeat-containing protein